MNYSVEWSDLALQALAAIWMSAAEPKAITAASNAIDRALGSSPNSTGIVLFDTVREYQHMPLGIEFEVNDATRTVFVLTCWDLATGRPPLSGN